MSISVNVVSALLAAQAFALSFLLVPVVKTFGQRFGFMDKVDPAKIHKEPMVRCGGAAIYLGFMATLAVDLVLARLLTGSTLLPAEVRPYIGNVHFVAPKLLALLAGATLMFVTGLVDDRHNLRPGVKLVLQIVSAVPLILAGVTVRFFIPGEIVGALLTIAWVVLLTNAFNFIDNMNGLSSGVTCIAAFNFYLVSCFGHEYFMMAILAVFFGAVLGFIPHNFPKARIFMGDSGSLFNGYMLAGLSIMVTYYHAGVPTQLPVVAPILILGVAIFDTASVMYIRWRKGTPLMKGDQNHFSHRLVALGFTRTTAVLMIYLVSFAVGLTAVNLRSLDWAGAVLALVQTVLFFLIIFLIERTAQRPQT